MVIPQNRREAKSKQQTQRLWNWSRVLNWTRVLISANSWSQSSSWGPGHYLLAPARPSNRFFNTSNHHLALAMPFASSPIFHTLSTLPIKHERFLLSWRRLSTCLPTGHLLYLFSWFYPDLWVLPFLHSWFSGPFYKGRSERLCEAGLNQTTV